MCGRNSCGRRGVGRLTAVTFIFCGALAGCGGGGEPIVISDLARVQVDRPLPGEVAVMLPYDVRPAPERKGKAPEIEYIIPMPYVCVVTTRGNFVTSDGLFGLPYKKERAQGHFGAEPVVAAATGEGVFYSLDRARIFEGICRLRPPEGQKAWPLPPQGLCVEAGSAGKTLEDVCPAYRQGQELQSQALRAPLPECSSRWLLRVRIVHLYSTYHQRTVTISTSSGQGSTSTNQNVTNFPPAGNAVLDCELFLTSPRPVLIWQKVVSGSAVGDAKVVETCRGLAVSAFNAAVKDLVQSLSADVPRIHAYLERTEKAGKDSPASL